MSAYPQGGRRSEQHRTVAILCLLVLSLALRPGIVSMGPVLLHIRKDFGLTYSTASLLTSIPDVWMGVFVLCVPAISRRFGADRTVLLSLMLLGIATLLRALSHSANSLLFWTTLVGAGIAIAGALIGGWIKEHFPQESSLFMGIYAGGLSIGATVAAGVTEYISDTFGTWRLGAGMWCVLAITAIASWSYLTRRFDPSGDGPRQTNTKVAVVLPWRNKQAWFLAIFFGLGQFVVYACFAWIAPWNSEVRASHIPSGLILSMFTLLLALGSFTAGAIASRSGDRRRLLASGTIVTVTGLAGLAFLPTLHPTAFIVIIAFGQGMCFALGMMLPLDYTATAEEAHAWTMFVLFVGYLIAALGPFVFGVLRDWTEGYFDSYLTLLFVSAVTLSMIPFLKRTSIA